MVDEQRSSKRRRSSSGYRAQPTTCSTMAAQQDRRSVRQRIEGTDCDEHACVTMASSSPSPQPPRACLLTGHLPLNPRTTRTQTDPRLGCRRVLGFGNRRPSVARVPMARRDSHHNRGRASVPRAACETPITITSTMYENDCLRWKAARAAGDNNMKLTEEHEQIRETVKKFDKSDDQPATWTSGKSRAACIPAHQVFKKLSVTRACWASPVPRGVRRSAEPRLLLLRGPDERGALANMQLRRRCPWPSACRPTCATPALARFGSDVSSKQTLPSSPSIAGEAWSAAWACPKTGAGSDVANIQDTGPATERR